MTSTAQSKKIRKVLRLGFAGLISTTAVIGGALGLASTPAFATPIPPSLVAVPNVGSLTGDFSYALKGSQLARNVTVEAYGFASGSTVKFSWGVAGGKMTPDRSSATGAGTGSGWSDIGNIPRSDCGQTLTFEATGPQSGAGIATVSKNVVENCGPQIWDTSTGVAGDGFSPGVTVEVLIDVNGQVTNTQWVTSSVQTPVVRCAVVKGRGTVCTSVLEGYPGEFNINMPLDCGDYVIAVEPNLDGADTYVTDGWYCPQ